MNKIILVFIAVFITGNVLAATLTCQQVSDPSLEVVQFGTSTIEIKCSASDGSVSNVQITPNADPSTGITITNSQSMSTSISQGSSSTAKWSVEADNPNTYTISYSVSSDATQSWNGASTTTVTVGTEAQLKVDYVLPPSFFTPSVTELDIEIENIGGTTANNVRLRLNDGPIYDYPTTISGGATTSYTWTNETGFNESGIYTTYVYVGDTLHSSVSANVQVASANLSQGTGWNLISLPRVPSDPATSSVLSSIIPTLDVVWGMDGGAWKKYDPDGTKTLVNMSILNGYWVKRTAATDLEISGEPLSGGVLEMTEGWNLKGYPATTDNLNVNETVQPIIDDLTIIWGFDGAVWRKFNPASYVPGNPSHLHEFEHGRGYWYKVTDDVNLTFG